MHLLIRLLALFLVFGLAACTNMVPREKLPYPLTNETFADEVKVVTIPLPVIAASPNEGVIYGGLTAFLLHNRKDEVSTLLAPQVNYNQNFGVTTTLYGTFYPIPDRSWEFNISKSSKVNEDFEIRIKDKNLLDKMLELNVFAFYLTDGSARFFGFQSESLTENESNYGDNEVGFTFSAGYEIAENLQFVIGERVRKVRIVRGAVKSLPFIRDKFGIEDVPGLDGFITHAQRMSLVYNTLDSDSMPTEGWYARVSLEVSAEALGSSENFRHYDTEVKAYIPSASCRYISVFRVAYNQTLGDDVPFLERSILGGENTLRGYGRNRFIDSSYFLINLEERIRLFRWRLFNVDTDWEVAPFVDLGAVIERIDKVSSKNFEFNPGIGFRAVVRPNIVGRVDLGVGSEGPAVFVGLNYPF